MIGHLYSSTSNNHQGYIPYIAVLWACHCKPLLTLMTPFQFWVRTRTQLQRFTMVFLDSHTSCSVTLPRVFRTPVSRGPSPRLRMMKILCHLCCRDVSPPMNMVRQRFHHVSIRKIVCFFLEYEISLWSLCADCEINLSFLGAVWVFCIFFFFFLRLLNSLWHRSVYGSTLAKVMACCLTAPSHYLNQYWLLII